MLLLCMSGAVHSAEGHSAEGQLRWASPSQVDQAMPTTVRFGRSQTNAPQAAPVEQHQVVAVVWDDAIQHDVFERDDLERNNAGEFDTVDTAVPLPTFADRSLRVAAMDDPFDDPGVDPFEEPGIDSLPDAEQPEEATEREFDMEEPEPDEQIEPDPFDDDLPSDETEGPLTDPQNDESPAESTITITKPREDDQLDDRTIDTENRWTDDFSDLQDGPADRQLLERQMAEERVENEGNCEEEFANLKSASIASIDLSIRVAGNPGEDIPYKCGLGDEPFQPREWLQITYMWKASGLSHKPLYFEQVHLERYGHSWGPYVQPLVSGAHFFLTVPILPYKMGLKTPNECVYSLGYYRPGSCAPYMLDPVPFTWRAGLFQAGAVVGAAAVIP